jgi:NDP-sugar pyrophosphorylase family protein
MDAIIMAGGKGTRMRPLTNETPKPLLHVQQQPILAWTLQTLRPAVDRVLVVMSYLKQQIADYMAQQTIFEHYALVEQLPQPMGTGHAVQCCQPHLQSETFLVINGDDFYSTQAVQRLAQVPLGIMCIQREDQAKWGVAVTDEQGHVVRIHEKPAEGTYPTPVNASIGAYKLSQRIFEHELPLSARGEYELTDYVTWLAAREPVQVVTSDFWLPVGYPQDIAAAEKLDLKRLVLNQS